MLEEGVKAPGFKLPDEEGKMLDLAKFKGKAVVLYFYPKDDTSGCTAEAKDFSCLAAEFAAVGAEIIGISPDTSKSHAKFKTKHELAVRLAADEEKIAAQAYGVWVEKSMYGKTFMGVERSTFLIDEDGVLAQEWRKVKPEAHVDLILDALRG